MTLHYEFPIINHIDEARAAVRDCKEFIEVEKDGYTVINYVLNTDETFPVIEENDSVAAIRRECRGLIFDTKDGFVLSRSFHKFFNVNERDDTQHHVIDLSKPHIILDKLDGSMVRPLMLKHGMRWGTKMGITDTAMQVEEFIVNNRHYNEFALVCFAMNVTPIFEWVSRKNRIVLDYGQDELILTAVRDNISGQYWTYEEMKGVALNFSTSYARGADIPVVRAFDVSEVTTTAELLNEIRDLENIEGVVIRFEDGHMVKIKTEWYVTLHKTKEMVGSERKVVDLIINDKLDDAKTFMLEDDRKKIERYAEVFVNALEDQAKILEAEYEILTTTGKTRKDFALSPAPPLLKQMIFRMYDGKDALEIVKQTVKSNLSKQDKFDMIKGKMFYSFDLEDFYDG